jgi:hypothetical protein
MNVTVVYFNHRLRLQERRDHLVANHDRPTIEQVVDLFDSEVGTVLAVYNGNHCLHRSAAQISDMLDILS